MNLVDHNRLLVKIARLYYEQGMTQVDVIATDHVTVQQLLKSNRVANKSH